MEQENPTLQKESVTLTNRGRIFFKTVTND